MTAPVEGPPGARPWLRVARIGYLVAIVAVGGWLLWTRRDDIAELAEGARPGLVVLALVVGFVQLAVNAGFWTAALRALDEPQPFGAVLEAGGRSLLARYVPGSVWYAVGRSAILNRRGVSRRSLAAVAGLELGLSPVVGAALGVGLLLVTGADDGATGWLVLWVAVLAVACSPPVVNRALALVARRRGGEARRVRWREFLVLTGWMTLTWVSIATSFTLYLSAFPALDLPSVPRIAGSFMLAWVVGFLAVFAPQGIGVFEATLAAMLTDGPIGPVVVVIAGYRALMLVRDLAVVAAMEGRRSVSRRSVGSRSVGSRDGRW